MLCFLPAAPESGTRTNKEIPDEIPATLFLENAAAFAGLRPWGVTSARASSMPASERNPERDLCYVRVGSLNGNPFAQLAKVTYDGQGNGMATLTVSNNGTIAENINVVGTFTVNRDCTGTKTFGVGPSAAHFDFVITPDGKTITWIRTDTNFVLIGTAVRMDH
jgi:hypothetical protein